ncbi:MAG TPA: riboflavin biosynthesis protein RibF [Planctomycetota bacterium]|nr:riboflavin biosynthesis protein RibF [Planctomycetota bacterium]
MKLLTGSDQITADGLPGCVVTWGVFDGVHLAHQKILQEVVRRSKLNGVPSVAITFDRHPEEVLFDRKVPLIVSLKDRLTLIGDCGVDVCLIITFTKEFAQTTAEQFLRDVIHARLKAGSVILGPDSRFGRDREGSFELLERMAGELGLRASRVEVEEFKGRPVSSSLIRDLIREGRLDEAGRLLGRPLRVRGKVVRGESRGKELGFPTANLSTDQELRPPGGVYGARCLLDGKQYKAVVNIGTRPTFNADGRPPEVLEVHVLEYTGEDFYDRTVEVEFLYRLRNEKKFRSSKSLQTQIKRDIKDVRERD